jgi:hypothetical protein
MLEARCRSATSVASVLGAGARSRRPEKGRLRRALLREEAG